MLRIVLFTKDMPRMVAFYRDVLGLKVAKDEKGWKEFDANGCVIALHNGAPPRPAGGRPRSASGPRTSPPPARNFWAAAPRCRS